MLRARGFVGVVIAVVMVPAGWAVAEDQSVDVRDNSFAPATVTITAGDTVTWTQSGANPHSVTADDGSFDSSPDCPPACMGPGAEFAHTFEDPGEFGYYCKIHGSPGQGMAGTVIVNAAAVDEGETEPARDPKPPRDEEAQPKTDVDDAPDDVAGDEAADDAQSLPRTGGPALAVAALVALAGGAVLLRRRTM